MKYLLDTHTLLWSLLDTKRLSKKVREILENRVNEIFVSTIALWEIALKSSIGKLEFENLNIEKLPSYIEKTGYKIIDLDKIEAVSFIKLSINDNHKDPFDRIMIWQAISRNMTFITKDKKMEEYENDGLKHLW
jgi:PIN domain nuclease of toxin-antitoxin system